MKTDVLGKRTLCTPTINTVHTDPIHLPRDSTIFPTETPGAEENNTLEDKYGAFFHSLGLDVTHFLLHTKTATT